MCDCVAEAHKIIIALEYLDELTLDMSEEDGLWCVRVVQSSLERKLASLGCSLCAEVSNSVF